MHYCNSLSLTNESETIALSLQNKNNTLPVLTIILL